MSGRQGAGGQHSPGVSAPWVLSGSPQVGRLSGKESRALGTHTRGGHEGGGGAGPPYAEQLPGRLSARGTWSAALGTDQLPAWGLSLGSVRIHSHALGNRLFQWPPAPGSRPRSRFLVTVQAAGQQGWGAAEERRRCGSPGPGSWGTWTRKASASLPARRGQASHCFPSLGLLICTMGPQRHWDFLGLCSRAVLGDTPSPPAWAGWGRSVLQGDYRWLSVQGRGMDGGRVSFVPVLGQLRPISGGGGLCPPW